MNYKPLVTNQEVTAVDIPSMMEMSALDYDEYLRSGLLHVDHHDVLRSLPAGYPLATNKSQLRALISYLEELRSRFGA